MSDQVKVAEEATKAVDPDDFVAVSSPKTTQAAIRAARRYAQVPDTMTDSEAMDRGFLPPELISLFMQIFMDMIQNCLPNQPNLALRRIRAYTQETNEYRRLGDSIRIRWIADRWMNKLGVPRDRGDVVMVAKAIELEASGVKDEEFVAVQNEVLWLTV